MINWPIVNKYRINMAPSPPMSVCLDFCTHNLRKESRKQILLVPKCSLEKELKTFSLLPAILLWIYVNYYIIIFLYYISNIFFFSNIHFLIRTITNVLNKLNKTWKLIISNNLIRDRFYNENKWILSKISKK